MVLTHCFGVMDGLVIRAFLHKSPEQISGQISGGVPL
jgi:hypothetical protein